MTSGPPRASDAPTADHAEQQLAELLEQLIQQRRRGISPDFAALGRLHPALIDELRSLWAAVLVADCVGAGDPSAGDLPQSNVAWPATGQLQTTTTVDRDLPRQFGDYELLEELGRGGMGVVYKARQLSLGRIVALKMLLRIRLASPADLARFEAEAQSVARLDHPHLVPVYEVGQHAGQPYFTMKYVAGTTLAKRLADGPLAARDAAALLAPICHAIDYAHENGILHRDLKPSNILLDEQGRPHVADFGLAKRVEGDADLTLSGAILGTPAHMAPEQAAGNRGKLGPACDIYSLGTILYQMLTGRPPFQAASPVDTLLLVLEQDPLPPRLLNARADRQLEMIALKCLQKPPELRYASAKAMGEDLEAYLADEPIAARSGVFGDILVRWFRETHHATILENWGLLWIWHSFALLGICLLTNWLQWQGYASPLPYLALWIAGLGAWAAIFWTLRRRAGPVTFVERQIAHIWAASMISIGLLFVVEILLDLPVLSLSPVLGLFSGSVFLIKAGILSGRFYTHAVALYATGLLMAVLQQQHIPLGISLFGVVSAACFFVPGLKYYRQRSGLPRLPSSPARG